MKILKISNPFFRLSVLSLFVLTAVACSDRPATRSDVGAVEGGLIGAGSGAVIGHSLGSTTGGAVLGAGAGALVGGVVGSAQDTNDERAAEQRLIIKRQQLEIERQKREIQDLRRQEYENERLKKFDTGQN